MPGRGPLNWSTTVSADRSAMECIQILIKHGASNVGISLGEDKVPDGLDFVVTTPWGPQQYTLPINMRGTEKALKNAWREHRIEPRFATPEHARRVAWRVIKDWLESQLALVEAGVADLPQVMLSFMKVSVDQTMYEAVVEQRMKALEQG
jgi:hypothetical protein